MKNMQKGFSLVELIVAVSILVVLTAISLTTFSSVQKNSRDSKRKADLGIIQSALEQYHSDQGSYPSVITAGSPIKDPGNSKTYLSSVPSDPKGATYCYESSPLGCITKCTKYKIHAFLENSSTPPWPACGTNNYNYQVKEP